jgi:hypothetical protein
MQLSLISLCDTVDVSCTKGMFLDLGVLMLQPLACSCSCLLWHLILVSMWIAPLFLVGCCCAAHFIQHFGITSIGPYLTCKHKPKVCIDVICTFMLRGKTKDKLPYLRNTLRS